jgi:hypothetical protein
MLRRALLSPPVLISLIVLLLASTLPLYVSGYVAFSRSPIISACSASPTR